MDEGEAYLQSQANGHMKQGYDVRAVSHSTGSYTGIARAPKAITLLGLHAMALNHVTSHRLIMYHVLVAFRVNPLLGPLPNLSIAGPAPYKLTCISDQQRAVKCWVM